MTASLDHDADGFCVLRTPLLPIETLTEWSEGLEAPGADDGELAAALARDRARLTDRLTTIFARPEVRDALCVASPNVAERVASWRGDEKLGAALVKYLARMTMRPTPFGLFAGTSMGVVGERTSMTLAPRARWERRTQLDMHFLSALCERLAREPDVRDSIMWAPNSSLYEIGGRLRYAESDLRGGRRTYRLVAVDGGEAIARVLNRAQGGALLGALAAALVDDDVELADARAFVEELVDAQVLLPELAPPVTGPPPLDDVVDQLARLPAASAARQSLEAARASLAEIDSSTTTPSAEDYRRALRPVVDIADDDDAARALIVDMIKPAHAVLGRAVVAEIARSAELLRSLMGSTATRPIDLWRERFVERYGDREVPLAEALDEESGIGFQPSRSPAADASPLLAGLPWPAEPSRESWGPRAAYLFRRVHDTIASGETQLRLTPDDVERLRPPEQTRAPDALAALVSVAMDPERPGAFTIRMLGVSGPSGARLMGRFCHASDELTAAVRAHLRREEALHPEALFAEIVHLPEGRTGNLLARPVLRDHEIVFLGRSGAPADARIHLDDLVVGVRGDRVVLRRANDGREVVPRLTSAQNYTTKSLGTYRFLAALQGQGCLDGIVWGWGALEALPFLPRLVMGKTVLARARWSLSAADLASLVAARDDVGRHRASLSLREAKRLPRWVALADADNELALDLDNVMALDALAGLARGRDGLVLLELWPPPKHSPVTGPDGIYANELLVPFVARSAAPRARARPMPGDVRHEFLPGSEWLYAKLYAGTVAADTLVRDVVGPLARTLLAEGTIDRWFFIRYGDPDWHVRVRLHGAPEALVDRALPVLMHAVSDSSIATSVQLDTYRREVARYGGPAAIEIAERMWAVDSDAVVATLAGPGGSDVSRRWRLALAGIDLLFDDFGFDLVERAALARRLRDGYLSEHHEDPRLKRAIGLRFRDERPGLEPLVDPERKANVLRDLGGFPLLDRSSTLREQCDELRALESARDLWLPLADVAASHAHMFVNRLLRSQGRAHELVIYDFLDRLYRARTARA